MNFRKQKSTKIVFVCCLFVLADSNRISIVRKTSNSASDNDLTVLNQVPYPGWKCVKNIKATNHWKNINFKTFSKTQLQQFQCTWNIEVDVNMKIAISIPKIFLKGASQNSYCGRDFLQIIDQGKNQGRFCKPLQVTDYISIGNRVRIDVQGEYQLPHLLRSKKDPFVINYRAITAAISGFKQLSKALVMEKGLLENINKKPTDVNDDKDDPPKSQDMKPGNLVIFIICGIAVAFILILIIRRYFLKRKKKKENKLENKQVPSENSCKNEVNENVKAVRNTEKPQPNPVFYTEKNEALIETQKPKNENRKVWSKPDLKKKKRRKEKRYEEAMRLSRRRRRRRDGKSSEQRKSVSSDLQRPSSRHDATSNVKSRRSDVNSQHSKRKRVTSSRSRDEKKNRNHEEAKKTRNHRSQKPHEKNRKKRKSR